MSDTIAPTTEEMSWFLHSVERGKRERFFEIVTVTPELASYMLEHNTHNRRLSARRTTTHTNMIKGGRWQTTHQGLAFDKTGRLLDGQHRLEAIVKAEMPVEIVVSFGWDTETFTAIDTGNPRTSDDLLYIDGMSYPVQRAAVARMLIMAEAPNKQAIPDKSGVAQRAREMADEDMDYALTVAWDLGATKKIMRTSSAAAAIYSIRKKSRFAYRLPEFLEGLVTGANLPSGSPILKFRNNMVGTNHQRGGSWTAAHQAGCMILTWNAWVTDKKLGNMSWNSYGLPEIV